MSKKKFIEGMESLFNDEPLEKDTSQSASGVRKSSAASSEEDEKRSATGKNFTDDLQSFLQTAFDESYERQTEKRKKADYSADIKKRRAKPMSGLDALIRATVEPTSRVDTKSKAIRRMTVAFDEEKLSKLKRIARMEKAYLRDVIDRIVAEYIDEYESEKGNLL